MVPRNFQVASLFAVLMLFYFYCQGWSMDVQSPFLISRNYAKIQFKQALWFKDLLVLIFAGILFVLGRLIARRLSVKRYFPFPSAEASCYDQLKRRFLVINISVVISFIFPVAICDMIIGSTTGIKLPFSAWICSNFILLVILLILFVGSITEESSIESQARNKLQFIKGEKLLRDLSTWGIGGPCKFFVQVFDLHQLVSAIRHCNEQSMRYIVIGKGSNCLFDDLGFDGCVIMNRIEFLERHEPGLYSVGSGYPFNRLGLQSVNEGYTGLEFAGGIPGTVGGAIYMNAGANGQETSDAVESVEIITAKGEYQIMRRKNIKFGYRSSPFQGMKDLGAVFSVTFRLKPSESAKKRQQEYLERRKLTQPVGKRSAGSVFRNPPEVGYSAGQLIERAGLKGRRIGGAMVSEKHANFLVNCGGATSRDMLDLIGLVKETVKEQFGVELREEVLHIHPCATVSTIEE